MTLIGAGRLAFDVAARLKSDIAYARDVQSWADTKLGATMWSAQRTIADEVRDSRRVAVYSCHDAGKSWEAAVIGCHHIDTHEAKSARLITTAPTQPQVRGVLWNEINGMWETARERGSPMQGYVNQTEWWIGTYQAGIGRKPADNRPEVFAGWHAEFPLIILDEADGLAADVWDGIEALMTNDNAKLFAIGNPLDPGSRFAACQDDPDFKIMRIPYDATPNFTDEGEMLPASLRAKLLGRDYVERGRRIWGEEHPYWYGRVLAQYPPESMATIIRVNYIELCQRPDEPAPEIGFVQLGVDVAGSEGGDHTSIRERRGNTALRSWDVQTADDDAVEELVVETVYATGARRVCIDATGFGHFFPGRIRKRCPGVEIVSINFGAGAEVKNDDVKKSRKYANMRAQLYWETGRELMRQGEINLAHMADAEETIADLTSARYDPEALAKNLIQVESKDDIKKRLGRSPDKGDAFLLAFHEPLNAGGPVRVGDTSRFSFPRGAVALGRT